MRSARRCSARYRDSARFVVESLENRMLLSAGDLDPTFGTGGKIFLPSQETQVVAVQTDGKILLAAGGTIGLERLDVNGTVDISFGTNGAVSVPFGVSAIAIQPDGKIVLGGDLISSRGAKTVQFAVGRYNTNGTPDTSFGSGGEVLTQIPGSEAISSIALTTTGQIVAGGLGTYQDPSHPTDPNYSANVFDVARYNANGSLDTTFGGKGYVYRQLEDYSVEQTYNPFETLGVAVQPDGKVLVGSHMKLDFAVWRFNTNGTSDVSFGLGGMATTQFIYDDFNDDYENGSISQLVVQPNGQILAAGPVNNAVAYLNWAVARFNADGSLDGSFGNLGASNPGLSHVFPTPSTGASGERNLPNPPGGLALQSDGRIIVGGIDPLFNESTGDFFVSRLLPNGAIDSSFHSQDIEFQNWPGLQVGATALAPDGRIVIAGNFNNGLYPTSPGFGLAVARLQGGSSTPTTPTTPTSATGFLPADLNFAFSSQGRELLNDPSPIELPNALTQRIRATALLPNGQVLLAGSIGTVANNGQGQFYLERLNADGTLDSTFGSGGTVATSIGPNAFATSILVAANGQIILGGATDNSATAVTSSSIALARYNANGSLDPTFGTGGVVVTDFPGNEEVDSLALTSDGKIVAAGSYFLYPNAGFEVARYDSTGRLDTSFNATGMLSYNLGQTGSDSDPAAVAVQADNKIVVGAHAGNEFALYRFNASGSIDFGFGNLGIATTAAALTGSNSGFNETISGPDGGVVGAVTKLLVQPDGRILAAGQTPFSSVNFAMARFNTDGTLDRTFGTNGVVAVFTGFNPSIFHPALYPLAGLALEANGSIMLVGNEENQLGQYLSSPGPALLLRRFLSNGTLDPTFLNEQDMNNDQDPKLVSPPPYRGFLAEGAALSANGNLIVAGDAWADTQADSPHWIGVAEYQADAVQSRSANSGGGGASGGGGNNTSGGSSNSSSSGSSTGSNSSGSGGPVSTTPGQSTLPPGQLNISVMQIGRPSKHRRGTATIRITNTSQSAFDGGASLAIYESSDDTLASNDAQVASMSFAHLKLHGRKSKTFHVRLTYSELSLPDRLKLIASLSETGKSVAPALTDGQIP